MKKLFKFTVSISVPAETVEEAKNKFTDVLLGECQSTAELDFTNIAICQATTPEQYSMLFNTATMLYKRSVPYETILTVLEVICVSNRISITPSDISEGILVWAERFEGMDDDEVSDWLA